MSLNFLINEFFTLGTGTNTQPHEGTHQNPNIPGPVIKGIPQVLNQESEEGRWYHYNEFIWIKSI